MPGYVKDSLAPHEVEEGRYKAETLQLFRQATMEDITQDDVEELLESHNEELTNDELVQLQYQEAEEHEETTRKLQKLEKKVNLAAILQKADELKKNGV